MVRFRLIVPLMMFALTAAVAESAGALGGTVVDPAGAVLPGVTVTATSSTISAPYTTATDEHGHYRIEHMSPVSYDVRFSCPGFSDVVISRLAIRSAKLLNLDMKMNVNILGSEIHINIKASGARYTRESVPNSIIVPPIQDKEVASTSPDHTERNTSGSNAKKSPIDEVPVSPTGGSTVGSPISASTISGHVRTEEQLAVPHLLIRITGVGSAVTTDSGEFRLSVPKFLNPGDLITFIAEGWTIVDPAHGRTFVPSHDQQFEIIVRKPLAQNTTTLVLDQTVTAELASAEIVGLNGKMAKVEHREDNVTFLGGDGPSNGLNVVQTWKDKFLVWKEGQKLMAFERPYRRSYAVLVAIDDYERRNDQKRRGKTGFSQLGKMIANAETLKQTLLELGFQRENIITLYDQQADSKTIMDTLQSFWSGASRGDADRVLFYFGGHGSSHGGTGLLVTYDYDPNRPTLSTVLMRDLTDRQSDNIEAHHLLIALDACSSGLALQTLGNNEAREKAERGGFRSLSIIRNDTEPKARNILLAGTSDQPAVYDNGGIFTQALIRGLSGEADLNHDGIIQFAELALFIKNAVSEAANQKGVEQTVGYYKLTRGGATGEVLFFKEKK